MSTSATPADLQRNKAHVRDYLASVVAGGDVGAAQRLVAPDVVQHGPDLADGLDALIEDLRSDPTRHVAAETGPGESPEPVFLIADGDLVSVCFSAPQVEPADPDRSYPCYSFTTFRIRGGLITERWPSMNKVAWPGNPLPGPNPSEAAPVASTGDVAANKQLVLDFYRCVFDAQNAAAVGDFVSEDYLQHAAHLPGGRSGLESFVRAVFPNGPLPTPEQNLNPPAVLLGEGDIVVLAGLLPQPEPDGSGMYPLYVYDAFRVTDGQIVEHWSGIDKEARPVHPGPPPAAG